MPVFDFRAVDREGRVVAGAREAADESALLRWLQSRELLPLRTRPHRPRAGAFAFLAGRETRLTGRIRALITRQLATLITAGLPLDHSLELLARLDAGSGQHAMLSRLLERVRGGDGLAAALAGESRRFPADYVALVRAGESGGFLPEVLVRLADALERGERLKEEIRSSLIYPAILVVAALGSILLLVTVVVPSFAPLFADAGRTLPLATRIVVQLAEIVRLAAPPAGLALLLAVLAYRRLPADAPARRRVGGALLQLPIIGPLLIKIAIARYARTLSLLLGGGVPLLGSLALAGAVVGNSALQSRLLPVQDAVRSGQRLGASFADDPLLPRLLPELVGVGEETGSLAAMLGKIGEILEEESRRTIDRLLALLTPAVTLAMGLVVAGVLAALFSAILSINELAL